MSYESLSGYDTGSFLWHWHSEIEFTLITKGRMIYQVNDQCFLMKEGEALFGNSSTLHSGHMADETDCEYISITFAPRLLYGYEGSLIQEKYVAPVLHHRGLAAIHFDSSESWQEGIVEGLRNIIEESENRRPFYELRIQEQLLHIWLLILENCSVEGTEGRSIDEKITSGSAVCFLLYRRTMPESWSWKILHSMCIYVKVNAAEFLRII